MDDKYVELFIDLIRERPVIWRKRETGYKDSRGVKLNHYKDMVQKLAETYPNAQSPFTVEMLTKKWVNLKDTFNSHRRQYEGACASGAGTVSEPTWKWWPYFKWFLTAHREQRTTSATNKPAAATPASTSAQASTPAAPASASASPASTSAARRPCPLTPSTSTPAQQSTSFAYAQPLTPQAAIPEANSVATPRNSKSAPKQRKRKLTPAVNTETINKKLKLVNASIRQLSQPVIKNDRQLYVESIVPALERLTDYDFAVAKNKINNILLEMEFPEPPVSSLNHLYHLCKMHSTVEKG